MFLEFDYMWECNRKVLTKGAKQTFVSDGCSDTAANVQSKERGKQNRTFVASTARLAPTTRNNFFAIPSSPCLVRVTWSNAYAYHWATFGMCAC